MALHPPPGLPTRLQVNPVRHEVYGIPKLSDPIQDLPLNQENNDGSLRSYTILKSLGQGSASTVTMCNWHSFLRPKVDAPPLIELPIRFGEGTRLIALKTFAVPQDRDLSTVRELEILRVLPPHRNIITLYDYFFTPHDRHLYLALGAMEGNLYHLIRARKGRPFASGLVSSILHQTLLGLDWLHSNSFIHRDLIPENILVTTQGLFDYETVPVTPDAITPTSLAKEKDVIVMIKLCDFGLARHTDIAGPYTEYVSVRWYRAPEVILFAPRHTTAVDMWAVGVIAAEVLKLTPLFPGTDQMDQVHRIFTVLGNPSEEARFDTNGGPLDGGAWPAGVDLARALGLQIPLVAPSHFPSLFDSTTPSSLLNCIKELLVYDPERRLTSKTCLDHPYFHDTASHRQIDSSFIYQAGVTGQGNGAS